VVEEKKHSHLTRDGNDLIYRHSISLSEALCGTSFHFKSLSGETIKVNTTDEVVSPSTRKRIPNKGMPIKSTGTYGDLIVEYDIQFPKKLTSTQKQKFQELGLNY